jgi:hypothetical protein
MNNTAATINEETAEWFESSEHIGFVLLDAANGGGDIAYLANLLLDEGHTYPPQKFKALWCLVQSVTSK